MPRAVSGVVSKKRHKKILKRAKGYVGRRRTTYRKARETTDRAGVYAYRDRRTRKREFRRLWITRISAAVKSEDLSYSQFMHGLNLASIEIDRKSLSELAINDFEAFKRLIEISKGKLKAA